MTTYAITNSARDEQARIFEPFYRGGSHLLHPEGMGLGLAITRDLVTAHGGRVDLESVPDAGSSFTIRLPVAHPQPDASRPADPVVSSST